MSGFRELWAKLKSKKYREEFVAAQVKRGIPFQIRALMKKQNLNQEKLAELSGLTQGVISRAANPNYGNLTLNTVVRIAAGFDVAFIGRFVPFSELGKWFSNINEDELKVPTFSEENENIEFVEQFNELSPEIVSEIANILKRVQQIQERSQENRRMIEQIRGKLALLNRGGSAEKLPVQSESASGGMRKMPGRVLQIPNHGGTNPAIGEIISQTSASA